MLNLLTKIYETVNKIGVLDTKVGRRAFTSAYFFYKRNFEDSYVYLLKKYPQIIGTENVLDVGANVGYTAILFGTKINFGKKVFAIEPHPANVEKLSENVKNFNLERKIDLIQAAVGESNGEITLWENPTSHADHRILTNSFENLLKKSNLKSLKVPMITLDSFCQDHNLEKAISFIKIDVQGYEIPVLEGMREILKNNPNAKICLEYDTEMMRNMGFEAQHVFDFFPDYQVYSITRSEIKKVNTSDQIKDLDKGYTDLLFSRELL